MKGSGNCAADVGHADASDEIGRRERFGFGQNWIRFLASLDDDRIADAQESLAKMLGVTSLAGRRFLDAGSGSGLSSLVARRLGADVTSFDYDDDAVSATRMVHERFRPGDDGWNATSGSVLDRSFLSTLGTFDVVYSWGVLHHTGSMYEGLENLLELVRPDGQLYIAIYNDQGWASGAWREVKKAYNRAPAPVRPAMVGGFGLYFRAKASMFRLLSSTSLTPGRSKAPRPARGMSAKHDLVDWVGGYPFEVAKPEEVFEFCKDRHFQLERLVTKRGGLGCNEFVFRKGGRG